MKDSISPEEKLLKLIRGQKKTADLKPAIQPSISPPYPSAQNYLSLNIKKIIWAAFVFACIYLAASFIYPLVSLKRIELLQATPEKITESKIEVKSKARPYEFYLEGVKNRQIFGSPALKQEMGRPAIGLDTDLIKDFNLVGIISGENPQAVIEDKKVQKTYYLSKGQFIGEFQIEDIQEGKIILNYQGQKFELYL